MTPDILVYGPAYIDILLETSGPLAPEEPAVLLDQSLPARGTTPREDGLLVLEGPTGDRLRFTLPPAERATAASYLLAEPVLARVLGPDTRRVIVADYPVTTCRRQLGGMGAGYSAALPATLRMPLGDDAVAREVQAELAKYGIAARPARLTDCPSDTSLVLLSARGEKLAVGVPTAMVRWQVTEEDRALVAAARALVFCGAPNALLTAVLGWQPAGPVMCAPAMRNLDTAAPPLAALAAGIHYLSLNALEWAHLADREQIRQAVPVISVTDGPHGSMIYARDVEFHVPALPFTGEANTNRAGETYAATLFRSLLREAPEFHRRAVDPALLRRAAERASRQAWKQLAITGFAFPEED